MGKKGSKLAEHVETAKKTRVFTLTGNSYREIPIEVMALAPTVRTIDVSKNDLMVLPVALQNFIELKQLNVEHNIIDQFPYEIGFTKKLEILHAGHNAISEIPRSFSKLANLKEFYCQSNKLTLFPECLCGLKNLNILDLSKNKIKELPEHMETLQVMELNMNKNKLKRLPQSLGACPRLKVLRMEENQLKLDAITSEFLINSQVSLLAVDGNLFEMKNLDEVNGYDQYMERYTATKKKYVN